MLDKNIGKRCEKRLYSACMTLALPDERVQSFQISDWFTKCGDVATCCNCYTQNQTTFSSKCRSQIGIHSFSWTAFNRYTDMPPSESGKTQPATIQRLRNSLDNTILELLWNKTFGWREIHWLLCCYFFFSLP